MRDHENWFLSGASDRVPGFLTRASAEAIAALLSFQLDNDIGGNLAEIGTYKGKTFVGLVKATRMGEKAIGFDLFPADVEAGFREALSALPQSDQRKAIGLRRDTGRMSVVDWVAAVGAPIRFVHIDGGHNRAAVLHDVRLASSTLSPKAVVVFDDFLHDWYPDLTEGIYDALRASRDLVPVALIPRVGPPQAGGSKLVCATRDGAAAYFGILSERFADRRAAGRQMLGSQVLTFQGFS